MNTQKVMRFLFILVPVLLILTIWWHAFAPFLGIALIYLMLLVFRSSFMQTLLGGKRPDPTIYYQLPQQQPAPEPPPRANPPIGFDLTAQEYQMLSQRYQQGYQAPQQPLKKQGDVAPKYDHPADYEQPQTQYPQQMPPMV